MGTTGTTDTAHTTGTAGTAGSADRARQVLAGLDGIADWLGERYEHFHSHPELSHLETQTTAEIAELLESWGYEVHRIGGGVVGVLANGEGPAVLFRADVDALPVREQTGLPYASTATQENLDGEVVPVMHACGHDVHITAGLGAARLLAEQRDAWRGTYIALFQPSEENGEGAEGMVADGLVDKIPTPIVALGQHVLGHPAGTIGISDGPVLSTARTAEIIVHGAGSHGSMPHLGVDPIVLASAIVQRVQGIVSREIAPSEFGVVTVGALQAGSQANVIPDQARMLLNFRAYSSQTLDQLVAAVERIVRAECEASRSPREPEFRFSSVFPLTDNDADATATVRAALAAELGDDAVSDLPPQTASEDFSTIPRAFGIPYCYWGLGGFTADQEIVPNHSPFFAPAQVPTLATGVRAAVTAALAFLH